MRGCGGKQGGRQSRSTLQKASYQRVSRQVRGSPGLVAMPIGRLASSLGLAHPLVMSPHPTLAFPSFLEKPTPQGLMPIAFLQSLVFPTG